MGMILFLLKLGSEEIKKNNRVLIETSEIEVLFLP